MTSRDAHTMIERGSSKLLGNKGIAFLKMNLHRDGSQFLTFENLKTLFHEFGHALNISLSNTKYQYLSGARGTTDTKEIPSHFIELYLNEYSFVK